MKIFWNFFSKNVSWIFPGNWLGWICGNADTAVETNCHGYTTLDDLDPAIVKITFSTI